MGCSQVVRFAPEFTDLLPRFDPNLLTQVARIVFVANDGEHGAEYRLVVGLHQFAECGFVALAGSGDPASLESGLRRIFHAAG